MINRIDIQEGGPGPPQEFQFTCEIWVLFLQPLHSKVLFRRLAMAIRPHRLHTWSLKIMVIIDHETIKMDYFLGPVRIRHFKESLPQELSSAVRDLTVSFHFTEP